MEYYRQILTGYAELYNLNAIHRDLKPQNIMFNFDYLKIIDFGIAKFRDRDDKKNDIISQSDL